VARRVVDLKQFAYELGKDDERADTENCATEQECKSVSIYDSDVKSRIPCKPHFSPLLAVDNQSHPIGCPHRR
jgi:hypothetical protein